MNTFKQRCIELRKQDYSLLEIAKLTGRAKTSVYFHVRDLPLSKSKQEAILVANRKHLHRVALGRKGKSSKAFIPIQKWDECTVTLAAHLLFDGEITPRGCFYNNRNSALLDKVERCMKKIYAYPPSRYLNKLTGVSRICYFNVALGAYLAEKSTELLRVIENLSLNSKRAFLRAFFDDEGCMDFRPAHSRRRIRGYQKNIQILHLVSKLLQEFEIASRVEQPNEVVISGRKNLQQFQKEIGFSPGVYINGNRTNSIWKKHLEKRELLNRALKSFKD